MKLISTKDIHQQGVKVLVYGAAGSGKTHLIQTAPNPFIISSESGLLTLANVDIPAVEVTNEQGLREAVTYAADSDYDTICLDSVSDIAESLLVEYQGQFTDGRQAYGKLNTVVSKYVQQLRNIKGKHVYITAKEGKTEISGVTTIHPSMPGTTLTTNLPYMFDLVLRLEADKKGNRILQTRASRTQVCKDRSSKLDKTEDANLSSLFSTIIGA